MALQESGAISLANVQTEFGGTNPIAITEYYGVAAGVPASGTIALDDFYGTSNINMALNAGLEFSGTRIDLLPAEVKSFSVLNYTTGFQGPNGFYNDYIGTGCPYLSNSFSVSCYLRRLPDWQSGYNGVRFKYGIGSYDQYGGPHTGYGSIRNSNASPIVVASATPHISGNKELEAPSGFTLGPAASPAGTEYSCNIFFGGAWYTPANATNARVTHFVVEQY